VAGHRLLQALLKKAHQPLRKVWISCCAAAWLRCAVLALSPIWLICLGRCAPYALPCSRSLHFFRPSL